VAYFERDASKVDPKTTVHAIAPPTKTTVGIAGKIHHRPPRVSEGRSLVSIEKMPIEIAFVTNQAMKTGK
jgi:hypothetical protein